MGTPTTLHNVDERGYVFVTEAADCQIVTSQQDIGTSTVAAPTKALPGRRRIYFRNNHASNTVYIGGADLTTSNGYPIPPTEELILDVTDDIRTYAIASAAPTDLRMLELA